VNALREAGAEGLGVASIFTYGREKGVGGLKTRIVIFAYLKAPAQTHFMKHYPDLAPSSKTAIILPPFLTECLPLFPSSLFRIAAVPRTEDLPQILGQLPPPCRRCARSSANCVSDVSYSVAVGFRERPH